MPSTLKLNLYDNPRVFLVEAFRYVHESHEGDVQWKFVILNLVQAIELLVKERLKREHPLFVFKDIDKREFTVSLSDAIKRLSSIAKVEIDEKDLAAVRLANRWRNEI